jgi:hypothetical protein
MPDRVRHARRKCKIDPANEEQPVSYLPSIGKWMQEDPIDFGAGDANLTRVVGNDPTNKVDPSGLEPDLLDRVRAIEASALRVLAKATEQDDIIDQARQIEAASYRIEANAVESQIIKNGDILDQARTLEVYALRALANLTAEKTLVQKARATAASGYRIAADLVEAGPPSWFDGLMAWYRNDLPLIEARACIQSALAFFDKPGSSPKPPDDSSPNWVLPTLAVGASATAYLLSQLGAVGGSGGVPTLPPNARTADIQEVYRRLEKNHGISPEVASERLHRGKHALGIPANADLLFDMTGNVYDPVTRQWLFSLTTP